MIDKNYSEECFRDKLRSANWFEVLDCYDINEAWCKFKSKFLEIVDSVAPINTVRLKQRNACCFNCEILELISRRGKALYKLKTDNSPEAQKEYNLVRNATQKAINKAKRDHVKYEIKEN